MPDHIATPVAAPIKRNIIEPSKGDEALSAAATPTDGPVGLPPKLAMARGNALHALLQYLPDYAEDEREAQAKIALPLILPEVPNLHSEIMDKALAVLRAVELEFLFADNSRAEVAIAADVEIDGAPARITGRIDRLVISEDEVLIVDFKSDQNVPETPDQISPKYKHQLAQYAKALAPSFPGHTLKAAILWTQNARLMRV